MSTLDTMRPGGRRLARAAAALLALCGAMPDAFAGDLMPTGPGLWISAAALSLTLVTAVIRSQK